MWWQWDWHLVFPTHLQKTRVHPLGNWNLEVGKRNASRRSSASIIIMMRGRELEPNFEYSAIYVTVEDENTHRVWTGTATPEAPTVSAPEAPGSYYITTVTDQGKTFSGYLYLWFNLSTTPCLSRPLSYPYINQFSNQIFCLWKKRENSQANSSQRWNPCKSSAAPHSQWTQTLDISVSQTTVITVIAYRNVDALTSDAGAPQIHVT